MERIKPNSKDNDVADDVIWGVDGDDGIAAFIGRSPRETYYLISRGAIPVRKLAHRTITASRRELRKLFGADNQR